MRPFLSTAIALTLAFCVATAEAGPITGGMSISGDFKPVNGVTGALTTLAAASGLDFVALIGGASSPGTAGQFAIFPSRASEARISRLFRCCRSRPAGE